MVVVVVGDDLDILSKGKLQSMGEAEKMQDYAMTLERLSSSPLITSPCERNGCVKQTCHLEMECSFCSLKVDGEWWWWGWGMILIS